MPIISPFLLVLAVTVFTVSRLVLAARTRRMATVKLVPPAKQLPEK
jgi:hypothetical protein